jgi:head-tail adaptor
MARYRSLREKVESLQEALRRHKDRIDPKIERLRVLGTLWANAESVEERKAIESRELRVHSSVSRPIEVAHKVNKRSRIAEREKFELEEEVKALKQIVGDETSIDDPF